VLGQYLCADEHTCVVYYVEMGWDSDVDVTLFLILMQ